jgi:DNA helicase-2/ATP-dependent DNA helicase PcrA
MAKEMSSTEKIMLTLESGKNFVLQGAAGSGKTETLKKVLHCILEKDNTKKIACITYTDLATREIMERVGEEFIVCTIHSFLHDIVGRYRINIHEIIENLFIKMNDLSCYKDVYEQNKKEYDKYVKIYNAYKKLYWELEPNFIKKVETQTEYNKSYIALNNELNRRIKEINIRIIKEIKKKEYYLDNCNTYNKTRFDSLRNLTFGHDGLLKISSYLFNEFPLLTEIVQDKFDYIFIDEYQDANKEIIDIFLKKIGSDCKKTRIGLFGDSMQAIYDDNRIGDVEDYVKSGDLVKIATKDNYRCSEQVIEFINKFRDDGIKQQVALKNGENINDRKGFVKLYYSIYDKKKPGPFSSLEEKEEYLLALSKLIKKIENEEGNNYVKLMLTNKSISKELSFSNLYNIFSVRTQEVNELIEEEFDKLRINDLAKLCIDFKNKNYNRVLTTINEEGFKFIQSEDKEKITNFFNELLLHNVNISCIDAIEKAFDGNFIRKTNPYDYYIKEKNDFLIELGVDKEYAKYKMDYNNGLTTAYKMNIEKEVFDDFLRKYKKEKFYKDLFEDKIVHFKEVINYQEYIDENNESEYITMHKTKGGQIENVIVILDEFFWNEYNFKIIFDEEASYEKRKKSCKLFYVACSRVKKNLICVKIINEEEEKNLVKSFNQCEKIKIDHL